MLTKLEVLRSARKLLSDPKRWGKGGYQRINLETQEPCYCALGALLASCGVEGVTRMGEGYKTEEQVILFQDARNELAKTLDRPYVHVWNDDAFTTYEDVMAAFSATCERVFAEQQVEQEVAVSC